MQFDILKQMNELLKTLCSVSCWAFLQIKLKGLFLRSAVARSGDACLVLIHNGSHRNVHMLIAVRIYVFQFMNMILFGAEQLPHHTGFFKHNGVWKSSVELERGQPFKKIFILVSTS